MPETLAASGSREGRGRAVAGLSPPLTFVLQRRQLVVMVRVSWGVPVVFSLLANAIPSVLSGRSW